MVRIEKMDMGGYEKSTGKVEYKGFEHVSDPFFVVFFDWKIIHISRLMFLYLWNFYGKETIKNRIVINCKMKKCFACMILVIQKYGRWINFTMKYKIIAETVKENIYSFSG